MPLTHDAATLGRCALARLGAGAALSGVLVIPQAASLASVIADLELIDEASEPVDWDARVVSLPLR